MSTKGVSVGLGCLAGEKHTRHHHQMENKAALIPSNWPRADVPSSPFTCRTTGGPEAGGSHCQETWSKVSFLSWPRAEPEVLRRPATRHPHPTDFLPASEAEAEERRVAGRVSDGINKLRRCSASVPALKTQTLHPLAQFVQEDVLTLTRLSTRDARCSVREGLRGASPWERRRPSAFLFWAERRQEGEGRNGASSRHRNRWHEENKMWFLFHSDSHEGEVR